MKVLREVTLPFWNSEEGRPRAFWRILIQPFIMAILLLAVLVPLSGVLDQVGESGSMLSPRFALINTITAACVVASVWLAGRFIDRRKFSDFGLRLNQRNWWVDFGFGLGLGAALMAMIFAIELAFGWVTITGTFTAAAGSTFVTGLLSAIVLFIGVGVQEEVISRAYHLRNIAEGLSPVGRKWAVALALIASSLFFGFMHASNPNATLISSLNIALAGVLLGSGYLLTGELAIPIGLHITWNLFQGVVFGFPVSGSAMGTSVFAIEQGGDSFITGGAFGPEAGLIGIFAIAIGTAATVLWVKWRYGTLTPRHDLSKPTLRHVQDN